MSKGGRKKKPKLQKKLEGTYRKDRDNSKSPDPSQELPIAPATFNELSQRWFDTLIERLQVQGYASASHTEVIAMAAMRLAEIEDLTQRLHKHKSPVYKTKNTHGQTVWKARPEVAMRNEAMRHAQSLLAELGLTPTSMNKVALPKGKTGESKWGKFAK